ncbi:flagellar hook-associated protein 3 [Marivivens niveibacter]|uniref:Flagellar hook-associated protein 3 n=1 Tax=Marivivens niveibacter TaxID=1930667 RepID=A0A251X0Q4_9RHOB|nr:flagellar hook-associated protein FlgL [Marivivens niveibacter]OUD10166.1 flagellar hook-associated protein 3 [Marivivens niveibacter]
MSIGNVLFTEFATRGFARVQDDISELQALISSGKNDPRSSADQMRAAQLSAFKEQEAAVAHFSNAAEQASSRVALSDQAIGDAAVIMRRMQELAITAGNDTLTGAGLAGLRAEAETLRSSLVEIANRVDGLGQPLFSGYSPSPAFTETKEGVIYNGDEGRPSQRLSETLTLPVGVNGSELFGAVDGGAEGMFDMIDGLIASFGQAMYNARPKLEVAEKAELKLNADRTEKTVTMTIEGPTGAVEVSAPVVAGLHGPMIDAINAETANTGITASLADDGEGIILEAAGYMTVSQMSRSDEPNAPIGSLQQLQTNSANLQDPILIRTQDKSQDAMIANVDRALDHLAEKRAEVGAMGATVDSQKEALDTRSLNIAEAISGLEDLDVAAAVTRLQSLLLTRDASQQTFVKITQTSLFDYLR